MQERTKNINVIFLWVTGMLLFIHGIMPHHHHFDSVFEHHDTADSENHHENNPIHCHAFNDLIVDRTGNSINNISTTATLLAVIFENDLRLQIAETPANKLNDVLLFKSPPEKVFLKASPTRGSPAIT